MIANAWILPQGSGFWVVVETEDMLFYLSDPELEPAGFAIQSPGGGESFWVTTSKDASIRFDSREDAERHLSVICRCDRARQETSADDSRMTAGA